MNIARYLTEQIGPRQGGSEAEHRAADYLIEQFAALGLKPEKQSFRYVGWRPRGDPRLQVVSPVEMELNVQPMLYTNSTPDEGIVGSVMRAGIANVIPGVYEWPRFAVMDRDQEAIGYFIARSDGPAIPFPNAMAPSLAPTVIIGREDGQRIEQWLEGGSITVRLISQGDYVAGYSSFNVMASIPGEMASEVIVVCAHYDSAYRCPGAEDNASGVEALFRVAWRLKEKRLRPTVRLIAFGAEEWPILGSRHYVYQLKVSGVLDQIKSVINLDMVGAGEFLWAFCAPEAMRAKVEQALDATGLSACWPVRFDQPFGPSSDHWPFYEQGIPCVFFLFWPYPEYHLNDTVDQVSEEKIEKVVCAATYLIEHME